MYLVHGVHEEHDAFSPFRLFDFFSDMPDVGLLRFCRLVFSRELFYFLVRKIEFFFKYSQSQLSCTEKDSSDHIQALSSPSVDTVFSPRCFLIASSWRESFHGLLHP